MNHPILRRFALCIFTWLAFANSTIAWDRSYAEYARFIGNWTRSREPGRFVRYTPLKADPTPLHSIFRQLDSITPSELAAARPEDQLAYWINAYNVSAMLIALEQLPVTSWNSLSKYWGLLGPSFFFKPTAPSSSGPLSSLTLVDIEDQTINTAAHVLGSETEAPLALFALACPTRHCPSLRYEPYLGDWIRQQLDDAVLRYLSDPTRVKLLNEGRTIEIPALWDSCLWRWSEGCRGNRFTASGGTLEFLNRNRERWKRVSTPDGGTPRLQIGNTNSDSAEVPMASEP